MCMYPFVRGWYSIMLIPLKWQWQLSNNHNVVYVGLSKKERLEFQAWPHHIICSPISAWTTSWKCTGEPLLMVVSNVFNWGALFKGMPLHNEFGIEARFIVTSCALIISDCHLLKVIIPVSMVGLVLLVIIVVTTVIYRRYQNYQWVRWDMNVFSVAATIQCICELLLLESLCDPQ